MATIEENAAATTVEVPATDPSPAVATNADVVTVTGEAKKKEVKPKAQKKAHAPSHPKYFDMINEAISSLKERTGSSQYAITKFIEDKHGVKLPPNFKKMVLVQLRKLTADGKLTKIKNSFRLSLKTKPRPAKSAAAKSKSTSAATKPKAAVSKPNPKAKVKPAATSKPKPKTVAKAKAAAPVKPKAKKVAPKPKAKAPLAKVAKKTVMDMPSKKLAVPAKKKMVPAKVKAVKSPVKKAAVQVKKGKASPSRKVLARNAKK